MKHEIGTTKPEALKESWPGEFDSFSHFDSLAGIPQALFLITTRKESGLANACFHAWSSFGGDKGGFYAVMSGIGMGGHTYQNILREKEFCVNFLSPAYHKACNLTIENNKDDVDELRVAGLTPEPAKHVRAPRITEAFLTFECKLHSCQDLSGKGITALVIGEVVNAAIDEDMNRVDAICGEKGFMFFLSTPKSPVTGEGEDGVIAQLRAVETMSGEAL